MQRNSVFLKLIMVLVLCGSAALNAASQGKVDVCHIPPGNPANAHTINVSVNAVPAHLAHGDNLGACGGSGGPSCEATGGSCSSTGCDANFTPGPFSDCASPTDVCCAPGA